MKRFTRLMQFAAAAVALSAIAFRSSKAQSHAPFGVTDLSKLRWLEGTWPGPNV